MTFVGRCRSCFLALAALCNAQPGASQCPAGWAGVNCDIDVDECTSDPCQNGATCTDSTDNPTNIAPFAYECACAAGWRNSAGNEDCQINMDECASNPCMNGGTCTDLVNAYACACVTGYRDAVDANNVAHPGCEVHITPCALSEDHCSLHSECFHDAPGVYHCECHPGYSSDSGVRQCSMADYPCTAALTDAGGDLSDSNSGGACLEINECASSPCQQTWTAGLAAGVVTNANSCNDFVGYYTCTCQYGYSGFNCDVDLDECGSYPCQNGATCTDSSFAYQCTCGSGFSGVNCATHAGAQLPPSPIAPPPPGAAHLCSINSLFTRLTAIKGDINCRAGCHGQCPPDWYPGVGDTCNADCGLVFEPFWDECGAILVASGMGGMSEMSSFYDSCLHALYPPGSCGTFCNAHTYACFLTEVHASCCDEHGTNCVAGHDVPLTCPVGCALVFPEFLQTCRAHVTATNSLDIHAFEAFEQTCLTQDGLQLVQYAMSLIAAGCTLDLSAHPSNGGHRRRAQGPNGFLQNYVGSSAVGCRWDDIDDMAQNIDAICGGMTSTCSAQCAIATRQFTTACGPTLAVIMPAGDPRMASISAFETSCIAQADPIQFLNAMMAATCPVNATNATTHAPDVPPPPTPGGGSAGHLSNPCASSPCVNGATCTDSSTNTVISANAYQCTCVAGFANGVCEYDFISEYTARCSVQESDDGVYSGNCDVDVDECASYPCVNGATCTDSSGAGSGVGNHAYRCNCIAGFANGLCAFAQISEYNTLCTVSESDDGMYNGNCDLDINECNSNPCQHGATCTDSTSVTTIPAHDYSCACVDGYTSGVCGYTPIVPAYTQQCALSLSTTGAAGTGNCEIDVDECTSSPCQNGGTCHEGVSSWSCQCATVTVWTGEFCETARNVCSLGEDDCDPLYATCTHLGPGQHSCTCNIGWNGDGTTCYDTDECFSAPCQNGGTCMESACAASSYPTGTPCTGPVAPRTTTSIPVDSYSCACADGFADGMCTADWDTHGTAYTAQYSTTCTTQLGGTCSIDINECVSSPCANSAGCSESVGQTASGGTINFAAYLCSCVPGYDGLTCQNDVNECLVGLQMPNGQVYGYTNACQNGAACTDLVNAFSCACTAGYANGVCAYDFITEYTAMCSVATGGTCDYTWPTTMCSVATDGTCDVDVDECSSNPCVNGATCTESTGSASIAVNAYSCACLAGFVGSNCEIIVVG
jgi:hypothetical protein